VTDPEQPPSPEQLADLLTEENHERVVASLDRLPAAEADVRKRVLRALRGVAEDQPRSLDGIAEPLTRFLTDDDRAVRLTAAKLFVAVAQRAPAVALPAIEALGARVADDEEFYYVRARCAEVLGYVALEYPDAVGDPAILAEFRVGLKFEEPAVTEKLAEALSHVALGDPDRLRHHVGSLADHLAADSELVRYHLCTAIAATGCGHPAALADAEGPLRNCLTDENSYVRGRAAEALALLAGATGMGSIEAGDSGTGDDYPTFTEVRTLALEELLAGDRDGSLPPGIGTVDGIRAGAGDIAAAIRSAAGDEECPHCGITLPEDGPPTCPQCGAPR
jgi:HEAT repeat protein